MLLLAVHVYPPTPPGVMQLLRPLLLDIVPTVQQTAALALGRLANYNDDLAEAVVKGDILPQLVYSLAEQNVSNFKILVFASNDCGSRAYMYQLTLGGVLECHN